MNVIYPVRFNGWPVIEFEPVGVLRFRTSLCPESKIILVVRRLAIQKFLKLANSFARQHQSLIVAFDPWVENNCQFPEFIRREVDMQAVAKIMAFFYEAITVFLKWLMI